MRITIISLVLLIASVSTFSQTPEKTEKIKKYMEASGYNETIRQSIESMFDIYQKSYPSVDSTFWQEFKKELKVDDLTKLTIPIYDKYFTDSDLDALITFYQSPAGVKVKNAQPSIVKEATVAGAQWGRTVGEKIAQRMKEKGYQ